MQQFTINTSNPNDFGQCAAAFESAKAGIPTSAVIGDGVTVQVTINFTPVVPDAA